MNGRKAKDQFYLRFLQPFDPAEELLRCDLLIYYSVVHAFVGQQNKHGNTFLVWKLQPFGTNLKVFHHVEFILHKHHRYLHNAVVVDVEGRALSEIGIERHLPGSCRENITVSLLV